ncbi:MAG: Kelch repeat-containing protein [Gemmatimonadota bacterium]
MEAPSFDRCVIGGRRRTTGRPAVLSLLLALGAWSCGGTDLTPPPPPPGPPPPPIPGWSSVQSLPEPRVLLAAELFRGQVYAAGGQDGGFNPKRSVFRYDPPTDAWTRLGDLPATRFNLGLVVLGDSLYAVGGEENVNDPTETLWAYLPDTDEWADRALLPDAHGDGAVGALGGRIVAAAGIRDFPVPPVGIFHDSVMIYSQAGNQWRKGPIDRTPRRATRGVVVGQRFYAFGGFIPALSAVVGTVEAFDIGTETWVQLTSMPVGRLAPAVAAAGGRIHVFGGGPGPTTDHQVYDIATDSWTSMVMPTGRVGAAAVTLADGRLLVIGGLAQTGVTSAVDAFTPP